MTMSCVAIDKVLLHCTAQALHKQVHAHTHTLQEQVGSFDEGKDFDALLIKPEAPTGPFDVFYCECWLTPRDIPSIPPMIMI